MCPESVAPRSEDKTDQGARTHIQNDGDSIGENGDRVKSDACHHLFAFHRSDLWPLTAIGDGGRVEARSFDDKQTAEDWVAAKQLAKHNVYFNPATPRDRLTSKATKEDIASTRWLWTDADPVKLDPAEAAAMSEEDRRAHYRREKIELLRLVDKLQPRPTVVLDSGNGYQCFWKLKEPMPCGAPAEIEAVEARNRWLGAQFGGRSDNTQNVDRIMRLAGTRNFPSKKKLEAGITWESEAVMDRHRTDFRLEYDPGDFGELAGDAEQVAAAAKIEIDPDNLPTIDKLEDVPALRGDQCASLRHLIEKGHRPNLTPAYASRSEALLAAARGMHQAGCDAATVCAILLDARFAISESVLEKKRGAKSYALRQIQTVLATPGKKPQAEQRKPDADGAAKALAEINAEHFLSQEGGQWRIYTEDFDPERGRVLLMRSSQDDFKLKFADRFVVVEGDDGKPEAKQWGNWWIANPRRRKYKRISFLPGKTTPDDTYNLWRGFAVEPRAGDWSLLRQHMLEIVCSGKQGWFDYYVRWMARKVQHPEEQGWTAVAMCGGEGVGKGIVADNFGQLFGQHYLHISHSKHLVGHFNLHLRDCCLLFADEAFWAGDKAGESTLKMLITEDEIAIEGKGRDVVRGRNHVGLMIASNAEWAVPAGPGARRFFVLDVPSDKKGDHAYFRDIVRQMENGGRAAMLHDLLAMDLTGFEVRDIPETGALQRQKVHSLKPKAAWLYDLLMHGPWRTIVPTEDLQKSYATATRQDGASAKSTQTQLGMFLNEVFKGDVARRELTIDRGNGLCDEHGKPFVGKAETMCYLLPPLAEARRLMDEHLRFKTEWPAVSDTSDTSERV
jgi:Family of unknown function (DUF5906)